MSETSSSLRQAVDDVEYHHHKIGNKRGPNRKNGVQDMQDHKEGICTANVDYETRSMSVSQVGSHCDRAHPDSIYSSYITKKILTQSCSPSFDLPQGSCDGNLPVMHANPGTPWKSKCNESKQGEDLGQLNRPLDKICQNTDPMPHANHYLTDNLNIHPQNNDSPCQSQDKNGPKTNPCHDVTISTECAKTNSSQNLISVNASDSLISSTTPFQCSHYPDGVDHVNEKHNQLVDQTNSLAQSHDSSTFLPPHPLQPIPKDGSLFHSYGHLQNVSISPTQNPPDFINNYSKISKSFQHNGQCGISNRGYSTEAQPCLNPMTLLNNDSSLGKKNGDSENDDKELEINLQPSSTGGCDISSIESHLDLDSPLTPSSPARKSHLFGHCCPNKMKLPNAIGHHQMNTISSDSSSVITKITSKSLDSTKTVGHPPFPPLVHRIRVKGVTGLVNIGNTCFMNSTIQCLSQVAPLTDYFLQGLYLNDLNPENPLGRKGEFAHQYSELLKLLWSGENASVTPNHFFRVIRHHGPQYADYCQHDSQEFLEFLLDGLHEDLNLIKAKPYLEEKEQGNQSDEAFALECWQNFLLRNKSVVANLFQGQYKSTVNCPTCSKVSVKFDPFRCLSLPLPGQLQYSEITIIWHPIDQSKPTMSLKLNLNNSTEVRQLLRKVQKKMSLPEQKMIFYIQHSPSYAGNNARTLRNMSFRSVTILQQYANIGSLLSNELHAFEINYNVKVHPPLRTKQSALFDQDDILSKEHDATDTLISKELNDHDSENPPSTAMMSTVESSQVASMNHIGQPEMKLEEDKMKTDLPQIHNDTMSTAKIGSPSMINHYINAHPSPHPAKLNVVPILVHVSMDVSDSSTTPLSKKLAEPFFLSVPTLCTDYTPITNQDIYHLIFDMWRNCAAHHIQINPSTNYPDDEQLVRLFNLAISNSNSCMQKSLEIDRIPLAVHSVKSLHLLWNNLAVDFPYWIRWKDCNDSMNSHLDNHHQDGENISNDTSHADDDGQPRSTKKNGNALIGREKVDQRLINQQPKRTLSTTLEENRRLVCPSSSPTSSYLDSTTGEDIKITPTEYTLDNCFELFIKTEKLDRCNQWYCPVCKSSKQATKKIDLWSLPDLLLVNLKRFQSHGMMGKKIDTLIDYPIEGLDLSPYVLSPQGNVNYIYDLVAVSIHMGVLGGGHYIAYGLNPLNRKWYQFNDSRVDEVPEMTVHRGAYILLYQRRSLPSQDL